MYVPNFNTGLKEVASKYIRILQVNVTDTTFKRDIEENPYYPSLLSLSDTFNRYHISNNAFEIPREKLEQLEPPFISFITVDGVGNDFVLVKKITDTKVSYLYKNKKTLTISKEEFLKRYQNIVWIATPNNESKEPGFGKKIKEQKALRNKRILWVAGVISLFLLALANNINTSIVFSYCSILLLKLIGLATAVLLLVYEIDKSNSFVKNICTASRHTNCDAVLSSKVSKIMGISWGEIGFFYFSATTLLLLFPIPFVTKVIWIAIVNAFAVPYIVFSIYYQWRVVKQWCPLCLTVQAVLFMEFVWSIINFWASPVSFRLNIQHVDLIITCILLPVLSWYALKPFFKKAKDFDSYAAAYKRLQNNPEIFTSLLEQQTKVPDGWQHLGISIGNANAENTIIKVCNPYCKPCSIMHPILEEIINDNRNVQLKIIFKTFGNVQGKDAIMVKHLMAIAAQGNSINTQHALDEWYKSKQKDYAAFAGKYVLNGELKQQDLKLEAMSDWCREAEIPYTPTIFVNGYRLPENYDVKELKNIL